MNDLQQPGKEDSDDKTILATAVLSPALLFLAATHETRNGVPLLITGGDAAPVTAGLVNQLRDELP